MAKVIEYRGSFTSPMRGKKSYEVIISTEGYRGVVKPLKFTGDCVTITFGERDQNELTPIKSSQAEISILCEEAGHPYAKFYTTEPGKYLVEIAELGDTAAVKLWQGYLATSIYSQALAQVPYKLRLIANDGFAILKEKSYLNSSGEKYNDTISVAALLNRLIEPLDFGYTIDLWAYPRYTRGQQSHTFEEIAIPAQAIYEVFSEIPSYYDVLEAVLGNFALQMYQDRGYWAVRRIEALAESVYSNILSVISLDGTDNGLGVSTSAMLTIQPPIKEVSAPREYNRELEATTVLDDKAWQVGRVVGLATMPVVKRDGDYLRIYPGRHIQTPTITSAALTILPGILKASPNSRVAISFDIFNAKKVSSSVFVDVWLVSPSIADNVLTYNDACVLNGQAVKFRDGELLPLPTNLSSQGYVGFAEAVTMQGSDNISVKPRPEQLSKTTVSLELPYIPEYGNTKSWQIALVVLPTPDSDIPAKLFISVPKVTIEDVFERGNDESVAHISKIGIDTLSPALKWRTSASVASALSPSLTSLTQQSQVAGYFNAGEGNSDLDVVASMITHLRVVSTNVIEGEVDTREHLSLSSVVQYDNKHYYLNYIKHLLRRDIFDVQMCELPLLDNTARYSQLSIIYNKVPTSQPIALSSSIYYIVANVLYRYDCDEDALYNVREAVNSYIYQGVDCVTFVKESAGAAICEAYNDKGEIITSLTYLGDGDIKISQWASTARYDAFNGLWIVSNGLKDVVLYDDAGYEVKRYVSTFNRTPANALVLPYRSGFVLKYVDQAVTGTVGWRSEIVVYALHSAPQSSWSAYSTEVLAINDLGYVYRRLSDNILFLISCSDSDFVNGNTDMLQFQRGSTFVGMNCAIVAIASNNLVRVYDRRGSASASRLTSNSGSYPTLAGDRVVSFNVSTGLVVGYADIERIIAKY